MKKCLLSLLVCVCLLASCLGVTALAAEDAAPAATLYLNGEELTSTPEGTTLTMEDGGTATFTTVGVNATGGVDYALTLENVRSTKATHQDIGGEVRAAGLYFLGSGQTSGTEKRDTLSITLKGTNFILARGETEDASVTTLVSVGSVSLSGEGSLSLMAMPAEGSEASCSGMFVIGDLTVGASVHSMMQAGRALLLSGQVVLTDGATLRWPTELKLTESGMKVLMNGETAADQMIVAAPTDTVTRAVAVFNLWKLAGSPAPEGEYPFTDPPVVGDFMKDAIHWAGATGLAKGYGDGTFGVMDPITNEQFAVLFYRTIGSPAVEGGFAADYPYADTVSPWARDAMIRASSAWPMDPQGILTHGEMDRLVALLARRS